MKIKETIERDCCQNQDLKKYRGEGFKQFHDVHFCSFCGQLWHWKRLPGEMDAGWNKICVYGNDEKPSILSVSKPCSLQQFQKDTTPHPFVYKSPPELNTLQTWIEACESGRKDSTLHGQLDGHNA